jgi:hypothetical protein
LILTKAFKVAGIRTQVLGWTCATAASNSTDQSRFLREFEGRTLAIVAAKIGLQGFADKVGFGLPLDPGAMTETAS